jgi:hypothetical protein
VPAALQMAEAAPPPAVAAAAAAAAVGMPGVATAELPPACSTQRRHRWCRTRLAEPCVRLEAARRRAAAGRRARSRFARASRRCLADHTQCEDTWRLCTEEQFVSIQDAISSMAAYPGVDQAGEITETAESYVDY